MPVASSLRRVAAPLALLVGLAGCDLEFLEEEITLERNAASDTLDVTFDYRGVIAHDESDEAVEKAVAAARRILAGRREFMILDWPLHFDLDDGGPLADASPAVMRFVESVSVESVEPYVDARGRLSCRQRVRVREASGFFRLLNSAISSEVLEAEAEERLGAGAPWFDERSRALFVERAESGKPWVTLGRRGLEIDLPLTAPAASGALRELARDADIFKAALLSTLRYLKVDDERTVARLGDVERGGAVRLSLRRDDLAYSPALAEALRAASLTDR